MANKITTGTPFAQTPLLNTGFINKLVDLVAWFELQRGPARLAGQPTPEPLKIKNLTGADRARGEIVQLGDYLLDAIDARQLWFEGNTPAEPLNRIAILTNPAPVDSIQPARVNGACVARVNVSSLTHTRAGPTAGSYVLASSAEGAFEILSNLTATGEQDAVVLLGSMPWPLLGKTDSAHAIDAAGTVSVWTGTPGAETDSGLNVTAYNRFGAVDASRWVWVAHNGYGLYLTAARCAA